MIPLPLSLSLLLQCPFVVLYDDGATHHHPQIIKYCEAETIIAQTKQAVHHATTIQWHHRNGVVALLHYILVRIRLTFSRRNAIKIERAWRRKQYNRTVIFPSQLTTLNSTISVLQFYQRTECNQQKYVSTTLHPSPCCRRIQYNIIFGV